MVLETKAGLLFDLECGLQACIKVHFTVREVHCSQGSIPQYGNPDLLAYLFLQAEVADSFSQPPLPCDLL